VPAVSAPEDLDVGGRLLVPAEELRFTYARSSGPGGQNVNKVSTKAILRWDVAASASLPADVRARLVERHGGRVNTDGVLVIACDEHRSQARNTEECLERLRALLAEALDPPPPRVATRPSRAAKRRRLDEKRLVADKKRGRRSQGDD
jgi:ribosome-associated protein